MAFTDLRLQKLYNKKPAKDSMCLNITDIEGSEG